MAIGVLLAGTALGADASAGNFSQIAKMEAFQLEEWGSFWTADFQGERLFAAYAEDGFIWAGSNDTDLTKHGYLSRVLINDVEDRIFTSGTPLELEEGYELVIASVNLEGDKVYVELFKDGNLIDAALISTETVPCGQKASLDDLTYTYSKDVGESHGIVSIAVHFKNAFRGAGLDFATVDGIWQISETPIGIGEAEVQVPQSRDFQLVDWGHFWTVESDGEEHFAAYAEDSCLNDGSKEPDLIKHGMLSRIIFDDSQERTFTSGAPLELEEDYILWIEAIDLEGDKVFVELLKDGRVVDAAVINSGTPGATVEEKTFTYTRDLGKAEDVVAIAVHFKSSFRGAEQDLVEIDGIWQISETPINV